MIIPITISGFTQKNLPLNRVEFFLLRLKFYWMVVLFLAQDMVISFVTMLATTSSFVTVTVAPPEVSPELIQYYSSVLQSNHSREVSRHH